MSYNDYDYGKSPCPQGQTADGCGQAVSGGLRGHRPSPLEEMQKAQASSQDEQSKRSRGIDFLRDHPEFNEFITLIRIGAIGIMLAFAVGVHAQATKPSPPSPAPAAPAISDALRAEFFKAQSQMIQSSAQAKEAQSQFQSEITKMQQVCGETSTLQMSQTGDPVCVTKPAAKK